MTLIREIDYGTPIRAADIGVTLTIDGQAVTVPKGTSVMAAAATLGTADSKAVRDRQPGAVRLLPAVPGADRGPARHPGLLHHARRRSDGGAHAEHPTSPNSAAA